VVSGALSSAVNEMSVVIERTARSPVVALSHDYSNALYTMANGYPEMIIQGQDQPCHLGGMLFSVKSVAQRYGDDLRPGDVIVANDPTANGTHLLDIDLIQPIFADGRLVGWACSRAHEVDIGGPVAGGYNPSAEDIFAEGLRIPPIKLVDAGAIREDVWEFILANVRSPHLLRGDMGAQLSAVRVATRRVEELCSKYALDVVEAAMAELLDRAERLMRAQIAAMPDGVYRGEQWIQEDGRGAADAAVTCVIEVTGDKLRIGLESPPATESYRNSYGGLTLGAVYYGVISGLDPGLPINEGLYRPLEVDLGPTGTMLNAEHPAACAMSTGDIWTVVFDAVCDAMAHVVPERACAGWTRTAIFGITGVDPRLGEEYTSMLHIALMGGAGAVYGMDGGGLWGTIPTGGASTTGDIELLEFRLPLHFAQHELRRDSACPGRWRGALGAVVEFEVIDHQAQVSHVGDGTTFPSPSRLGGGSPRDVNERVHRKFILRRDGRHEPIPMHSLRDVEAGERVLCFLPGGGAVGLASERDPLAVAHDLAADFVSAESAWGEYGFKEDGA
jgi:N-methylhydantoinase B